MTYNLIFNNNSGTDPFLQQEIENGYDFPFTMNPTVGCFYGCVYCFSPKTTHRTHTDFFSTVQIKGNFPQKIDKQLGRLNYLPQHFKRVQINESNDIYHPRVFHGMKRKYKRDVMAEIYDVFKNQSAWGNKWMLHILTKSNLILEHLDILKEMKEMVQVEISICSPDNTIIRRFEKETPNLDKRLQTIEKLSKEGIFVRVMAMPFLGDKNDALKLKKMCFDHGAQGFKHKNLNYYTIEELYKHSWQDILDGELVPTLGRNNIIWEDLTAKSGEFVSENGDFKGVDVLWSEVSNWTELREMDANFQLQKVKVVDCGYAAITKVDFGYVV